MLAVCPRVFPQLLRVPILSVLILRLMIGIVFLQAVKPRSKIARTKPKPRRQAKASPRFSASPNWNHPLDELAAISLFLITLGTIQKKARQPPRGAG
jgi:hypothetical protein